MVCVVYDVSEEDTIEKVRELPIHPGSLPLAHSLIINLSSAWTPDGCLAKAALGRLTSVAGPVSNEYFGSLLEPPWVLGACGQDSTTSPEELHVTSSSPPQGAWTATSLNCLGLYKRLPLAADLGPLVVFDNC